MRRRMVIRSVLWRKEKSSVRQVKELRVRKIALFCTCGVRNGVDGGRDTGFERVQLERTRRGWAGGLLKAERQR